MKNLFLCIFIFCFPSICATQEHKQLIIIYGASCAGKSTLAHAIADKHEKDWIVIDRDELAENELSEKEIDQLLINTTSNSLTHYHVIIDTQNPEPLLNALSTHNPYFIFVYTSLPSLIKRDERRQQRLQRPPKRQIYARAYVLETFAQLLSFDSQTQNEPLDILHPNHIPDDVFAYPIDDDSRYFFSCILSGHGKLIYPKYPCHMIVKTDSQIFVHEVDGVDGVNGVRQLQK